MGPREAARIPLEGVYNLRDFGGYPAAGGLRIRRGRLYRSDSLARLKSKSVPRFAELGIRLLVDLRTEAERTGRPNVLPADHGIRIESLPLSVMPELERPWSIPQLARFLSSRAILEYGRPYMTAAYREFASAAREPLLRLFELLADPAHYPVMIHCAGGRDRTGFAAAMVLSALGASREDALADYCATNACIAPHLPVRIRIMRLLSLYRVSPELLRDFVEVHPEYLQAAFESLEGRFGAVERYLEDQLGVTEERRRALREILLERP